MFLTVIHEEKSFSATSANGPEICPRVSSAGERSGIQLMELQREHGVVSCFITGPAVSFYFEVNLKIKDHIKY